MNDLDLIDEDAPIDLVEGKKRLRSTTILVTDVSNLKLLIWLPQGWLQLGWVDVLTKLTACKEELQVWRKQCRGNYGQIVKELENRLGGDSVLSPVLDKVVPIFPINQSGGINFDWQKLWGLSIPPKIKNFLWCVIHDVFPSKCRLAQKGVSLDPMCTFCPEPEDTVHVLLLCDRAQAVWSLWGSFDFVPLNSIHEMMLNVVQSVVSSKLEELCFLLWMLWSSRNWAIWHNIIVSPAYINYVALQSLYEWRHGCSLQLDQSGMDTMHVVLSIVGKRDNHVPLVEGSMIRERARQQLSGDSGCMDGGGDGKERGRSSMGRGGRLWVVVVAARFGGVGMGDMEGGGGSFRYMSDEWWSGLSDGWMSDGWKKGERITFGRGSHREMMDILGQRGLHLHHLLSKVEARDRDVAHAKAEKDVVVAQKYKELTRLRSRSNL
ncbi:hypothetical protein ACFE04_028611 [Oxalis oulophora]